MQYIELMNRPPAQLTNVELLAEVKRLAQCERETTATLVAHLVEVERRELHHAEGCSSMFSYCTEVLQFSEAAAYRRLLAARAARRNPRILADLASGALNLSSIKLLAPHLDSENGEQLLDASRHKSKREVEKLVRERFPLADVPATVRKLPAPATGQALALPTLAASNPLAGPGSTVSTARESASASAKPEKPSGTSVPHAQVIAPLAAERYKVQFTASESAHANLRRAQDLLRHRIPNGDIAPVFELALAILVGQLEKQKFAATDRPRTSRGVAPGTRDIPAEVKRAVWKRDDERCAFIGENGRRCSETGVLEFHHIDAFGLGGKATIENIALWCRAHNQFEARREFGRWEVEADTPPE